MTYTLYCRNIAFTNRKHEQAKDNMMMMWRLNALLGQCKDAGEAISYRDLSTATGVSTSTIYQIAQNQPTRADLKTINALLGFFSEKMGKTLETGDLLHYDPDRTEQGDQETKKR